MLDIIDICNYHKIPIISDEVYENVVSTTLQLSHVNSTASRYWYSGFIIRSMAERDTTLLLQSQNMCPSSPSAPLPNGSSYLDGVSAGWSSTTDVTPSQMNWDGLWYPWPRGHWDPAPSCKELCHRFWVAHLLVCSSTPIRSWRYIVSTSLRLYHTLGRLMYSITGSANSNCKALKNCYLSYCASFLISLSAFANINKCRGILHSMMFSIFLPPSLYRKTPWCCLTNSPTWEASFP